MRISGIPREFGANNDFFEYLVLRFYDFKLLASLRVIRKITKSQTFLSSN